MGALVAAAPSTPCVVWVPVMQSCSALLPFYSGWHGVGQLLFHRASQRRPALCRASLHTQTEPQQAHECAPCWLQGLGKTAQSIATLAFQAQFLGMLGPHIVIAPLTTLGHWKREIQTWTDMVRSHFLSNSA